MYRSSQLTIHMWTIQLVEICFMSCCEPFMKYGRGVTGKWPLVPSLWSRWGWANGVIDCACLTSFLVEREGEGGGGGGLVDWGLRLFLFFVCLFVCCFVVVFLTFMFKAHMSIDRVSETQIRGFCRLEQTRIGWCTHIWQVCRRWSPACTRRREICVGGLLYENLSHHRQDNTWVTDHDQPHERKNMNRASSREWMADFWLQTSSSMAKIYWNCVAFTGFLKLLASKFKT